MKKNRLIQMCTSLIFLLFSLNSFCQYATIELKNGDTLNMANDKFYNENDQLTYFKEKVEIKGFALFGIVSKKKKEEYRKKTNTINLDEVELIRKKGEFSIGKKIIANYIGYKYIKIDGEYEKVYLVRDDFCSLYIKWEYADRTSAKYSYYVQKVNEKPFHLHQQGTGSGPKYKKRSKEFFNDCQEAMDYIENGFKRLNIPELVDLYNSKCVG
ncbi:hypothetical protein [Winogradskyella sp. SYSU M77433]|uniref:hypothetical protein n=1 Tax=Winogradskyella sp. SYSU M77433 TaxID=3042722 RepID=UPI002480603A|nr:hypothetical protein [Winogradskyella sp. SYSU M77433]MDH7914624.1 hypothetical protein [Winogradskyella sp. SYSU M77433]